MNKQNTKYNSQNTNNYRNLEERTLEFSKRIIKMCKTLIKNTINKRLTDQCLRSGTSIGANYREANEALTKKDFIYRIKIARKEAKETTYWLRLIIEANPNMKQRIESLLNESIELRKILSSILDKTQTKKNSL